MLLARMQVYLSHVRREVMAADAFNLGTDEAMPVEECGNMLIMTLSYAQKTGDLSLLTNYVSHRAQLKSCNS